MLLPFKARYFIHFLICRALIEISTLAKVVGNAHFQAESAQMPSPQQTPVSRVAPGIVASLPH